MRYLHRLIKLFFQYRYYFPSIIHILRVEGFGQLIKRIHRKISQRPMPSIKKIAIQLPEYNPQKNIYFDSPKNPRVTIVIPVYNKIKFTLNCLNSIFIAGAKETFEIVIVDDGSTDETFDKLSIIDGINYLRNEQNLGFIKSCNRGADEARGKYVVFLNNDTIVTDDWLDNLLKTFVDHPDAGLVGAKLVYPNGILQEAGGLVWRDGSAWNYGLHGDPNDPKYNYLRECDYCSGACLMIEKSFFNLIGRFDPYFAPAYYEDTDLAFKTKKANKKVFYQPFSLVYHFEGITSGTNLSTGIKRYQATNQKKFYERWHEVLSNHRPNGVQPEFEKERNRCQRVLIVDANMIMTDKDSGSVRMFHLIKVLLALNYKVTFSAENLWYIEKYVKDLQLIGVEVLYAPFIQSLKDHLKHYGHVYDIIMLSRADVADTYIDIAKAYGREDLRIIFDTVDLHFLREKRQAELEHSSGLEQRAKWRMTQELNIIKKAYATLVVSQSEKDILTSIDSNLNIHVLSNIHPKGKRKTNFSQRNGLLFIGAYDHPPNVDAMVYFSRDIFPKIISHLKDVKLYVVGSNPNKRIERLASKNIIVVGYAEDLAPYLEQCRVAVAPLRFGAGVKGKINTYLNAGLPVVATSLAAEGMYLKHECNALIADTPKMFADQVIRLYTDEELWLSISDAGLKNMADHFSYEAANKCIKKVFDHSFSISCEHSRIEPVGIK